MPYKPSLLVTVPPLSQTPTKTTDKLDSEFAVGRALLPSGETVGRTGPNPRPRRTTKMPTRLNDYICRFVGIE